MLFLKELSQLVYIPPYAVRGKEEREAVGRGSSYGSCHAIANIEKNID